MQFLASSITRVGRSVALLERAVLDKDSVAVDRVREEISLHNKTQKALHKQEQWLMYIAEMANNILVGKHLNNIQLSQDLRFLIEIIPSLHELSAKTLMSRLCIVDSTPDELRRVILGFLCSSVDTESILTKENEPDSDEVYLRSFTCLILGISYLEIYCRVNYTGPELSLSECEVFGSQKEEQFSLTCLECDGIYPYSTILLPQTILIARIFLATIADYRKSLWNHGILLDDEGRALLSPASDICDGCSKNTLCMDCGNTCLIKNSNDSGYKVQLIEQLNSLEFIPSRYWWSARAAVLHGRMLTSNRHDQLPSLWVESMTMHCASIFMHDKEFTKSISADVDFAKPSSVQQAAKIVRENLEAKSFEYITIQQSISDKALLAQAWLEIGLCWHYFAYRDKGKKFFNSAKQAAGLSVEMSAALGVRTKWQRSDTAQLFILAKSSLYNKVGCSTVAPVSTSVQAIELEKKSDLVDGSDGIAVEEKSGWTHSEWELGRRLVSEAAGGEEAAVREVMLDSMDGGPEMNIILEGGPRFADKSLDKGGPLHPIDQAILLALCLDVSNSNPADGLTNEEMLPYIEKVLSAGSESNWMVYSTALLERSWLEFERRKTADRAMLQMQALIDQHSTKLTITQSTYKSIEESAPAQDRLRYICSVAYLSHFELKRDLAFKYLQCQVFASALNYFRELELWDEVVTCYQLMQKPQRAELVVRERLKHGETPYMLTALADLSQKEEYYEQAWSLSKGRYPRCMRTLAKICHDRGQFEECCNYLDKALAVQPLVPTAWYLKGISCMRLQRWDDAVMAFVRCVQQDLEIGEAWANIGAIHMRLKQWNKAYPALTEALKHKHGSWKVLENLMAVCLSLGRWRETAQHMNALLDQRLKSQRPVHIDELRHLAFITSNMAQREAKLAIKAADCNPVSSVEMEDLNIEEDEEETDFLDLLLVSTPTPEPAQTVEKLLIRITNTVASDADVWEVLADFQHTLGRFPSELEARVKQFRAIRSKATWERDKDKITAAVATAAEMVKVLKHLRNKTEFFSCKSLLRTAAGEIDASRGEAFASAKNSLNALLEKLDKIFENVH